MSQSRGVYCFGGSRSAAGSSKRSCLAKLCRTIWWHHYYNNRVRRELVAEVCCEASEGSVATRFPWVFILASQATSTHWVHLEKCMSIASTLTKLTCLCYKNFVVFQVYVNSANVDKYLIDSITKPADDPNAGEVYYRYDTTLTWSFHVAGWWSSFDCTCRLMSRFMSNQRKYTLDSVLSQLSCPLLLVWGDLDPWVGPGKALRIKEFYRDTWVVNLQAGHCPHDEVPELVNKALLEWLSTLTTAPSLQPLWLTTIIIYVY